MDCYIGTKIILAEPMTKLIASQRGLLRSDVVVEINADGYSEPGYKIVYEDGYTSWSPKDVFERAYRRVTAFELGLVQATMHG